MLRQNGDLSVLGDLPCGIRLTASHADRGLPDNFSAMSKVIWGIANYPGWISGRSAESAARGSVEECLYDHADKGIDHVVWTVGGSVVYYWSEVEGVTRLGDVRNEKAAADCASLLRIMKQRCLLDAALEYARANGMVLYARLDMNMHAAASSPLRSRFADKKADHYCACKDGSPDPSRLCFFFREVRAERVNLVRELAQRGVYVIQVDFCRNPPMIQYHPGLRKAYRKESSVDPAELSPTDRKRFLPWALFRADYVTEMMRDIRRAVDEVDAKTGRRTMIQARVSDLGIEANLLNGVNVVRWLSERLIDELALNPMEWIRNYHVHDTDVYVDLCRDNEVTIYGGVSGIHVDGFRFNPLPIARRARRLLEDGVDGIQVFCSETAVHNPNIAWLLPDLADGDALQQIITDRSLKKKYPITWLDGNCGLDRFSSRAQYGWSEGAIQL